MSILPIIDLNETSHYEIFTHFSWLNIRDNKQILYLFKKQHMMKLVHGWVITSLI